MSGGLVLASYSEGSGVDTTCGTISKLEGIIATYQFTDN
jgi:hypothetical protein